MRKKRERLKVATLSAEERQLMAEDRAISKIRARLRNCDPRMPLDRIKAEAIVETERVLLPADDDDLAMSDEFRVEVERALPWLVDLHKKKLKEAANGWVAMSGKIGVDFRYKHFVNLLDALAYAKEQKAKDGDSYEVRSLSDVLFMLNKEGTYVFWRHMPVL